MKNNKEYFVVSLEVALKNSKHIFGFINISHIPYKKFEKIFKSQITDEKFLFGNISSGYFIDKGLYKKHKRFFDTEIPFKFDFDLFEYNVNLSGGKMSDYKKDYYETLPPLFHRVL